METFRSENNLTLQTDLESRQIEAFLDLLSDFWRVKLSVREIVPQLSAEMQAQLQAAGLDVAADGEQIGFLRQIHRVLKILKALPSGCSMGDISGQLGVSLSNATRVIEQMVQRNLLERHASAEDRRVILVRATPTGLEVYRVFNEAFCRHLEQMLGQLEPGEREQLLYLGRRLFDIWSTTTQSYGRAK